jgi:hypothetical protein
MSAVGYSVRVGEGVNASDADILEKLLRNRFSELDPAKDDRNYSAGCVVLGEHLNSDFTLPQIYFAGRYIGFTLREDAAKVSGAQLKLYVEKRVREYAAERSSAGEFGLISRSELRELKENVRIELFRKLTPTIRMFDVIFDTEGGRVWFFGKSKKVREVFFELFQDIFGVSPVEDNLYSALERASTPTEADQFLSLSVLPFGGVWEDLREKSAVSDLSLASKIKRVEWFGPEFLTYLFFRCTESASGSLEGVDDVSVSFVDSVSLESVCGDDQTTLKGTDAGNRPEILTALREGQLLTGATLSVLHQDRVWMFSLDAHTFQVSGVKVPSELDEDDDSAEQKIIDRFSLLETLEVILHRLLGVYIRERLSSLAWRSFHNRVHAAVTSVEQE